QVPIAAGSVDVVVRAVTAARPGQLVGARDLPAFDGTNQELLALAEDNGVTLRLVARERARTVWERRVSAFTLGAIDASTTGRIGIGGQCGPDAAVDEIAFTGIGGGAPGIDPCFVAFPVR
ncbi:MAG TPA: hypothetical protein VGF99_03825, partial [Myxococcota bacterium]